MWFKEDLFKIWKDKWIIVLNKQGIAKHLSISMREVQDLLIGNNIPKISRGLYLIADLDYVDPFSVAYIINMDSYISIDSALYHYHLIPEFIRPNYSVTSKKTKNVYNQVWKFIYRHLRSDIFFWYYYNKDQACMFAEREKAILDYFHFTRIWVSRSVAKSAHSWKYISKAVIHIFRWFQSERFQNLDTIDFMKLSEYWNKMNKRVSILAKLLENYYLSEYYENHQ